MLSRKLIIAVALIALSAGCTTWVMRTWQSQGYEASVILAARSNRHLGSQEQRDRYVELINDLDPSTLRSYNEHQLTSLRAHHEKRRALLSVTVTANTPEQALAGANAISTELVTEPIDTSLDLHPLQIARRVSSAHSTSNPLAEGGATAVVFAVLGIAGLALLTPRVS